MQSERRGGTFGAETSECCTDVYSAQFPIHDVVEEMTACTGVAEGGSIGEEVAALQIDPHVLVGLGSSNGTGICRCGYTSVDPDIGHLSALLLTCVKRSSCPG